MHQEKYSLKWDTYSDHLMCMMKELMINEDFSDVTLVTEDKKQIRANSNILSACSPVFKDILKKNRNSSLILFLRGIQYCELEPIIQFIYLGEATFFKERMDEFLAVAKSLEIKELCNNGETKSNDEPEDDPKSEDQDTSTELVEEQKQTPQLRQKSFDRANGKYECDQCHKKYSGSSALNTHKQAIHQGLKYACDQCDYQGSTQGNLTVHIQSKHKGIKYVCNQCDYQATQQSNLTKHIQSKHEGIRYVCNQCDFKAMVQYSLTQHIQSKHEGVKYACDQCDWQGRTQGSLTLHIQSKHEGIRYACNQCDYQATQQSNLTKHIQSKHEGIRYDCSQCDYQATTQDSLKRHIQSMHKGVKYASSKPPKQDDRVKIE